MRPTICTHTHIDDDPLIRINQVKEIEKEKNQEDRFIEEKSKNDSHETIDG